MDIFYFAGFLLAIFLTYIFLRKRAFSCRIVIILFLFLLSGKLLLGIFEADLFRTADRDIIFRKAQIYQPDFFLEDYNVLFSKAEFDLRMTETEMLPMNISVVTLFAATTISVPSGIPFRVEAEGVFAITRMPPGNASSFGKVYYETDDFNPLEPHLIIGMSTVLGTASVEISR